MATPINLRGLQPSQEQPTAGTSGRTAEAGIGQALQFAASAGVGLFNQAKQNQEARTLAAIDAAEGQANLASATEGSEAPDQRAIQAFAEAEAEDQPVDQEAKDDILAATKEDQRLLSLEGQLGAGERRERLRREREMRRIELIKRHPGQRDTINQIFATAGARADQLLGSEIAQEQAVAAAQEQRRGAWLSIVDEMAGPATAARLQGATVEELESVVRQNGWEAEIQSALAKERKLATLQTENETDRLEAERTIREYTKTHGHLILNKAKRTAIDMFEAAKGGEISTGELIAQLETTKARMFQEVQARSNGFMTQEQYNQQLGYVNTYFDSIKDRLLKTDDVSAVQNSIQLEMGQPALEALRGDRQFAGIAGINSLSPGFLTSQQMQVAGQGGLQAFIRANAKAQGARGSAGLDVFPQISNAETREDKLDALNEVLELSGAALRHDPNSFVNVAQELFAGNADVDSLDVFQRMLPILDSPEFRENIQGDHLAALGPSGLRIAGEYFDAAADRYVSALAIQSDMIDSVDVNDQGELVVSSKGLVFEGSASQAGFGLGRTTRSVNREGVRAIERINSLARIRAHFFGREPKQELEGLLIELEARLQARQGRG